MRYDFKCLKCSEITEIDCKLKERNDYRDCKCGGQLRRVLYVSLIKLDVSFPGEEIRRRDK